MSGGTERTLPFQASAKETLGGWAEAETESEDDGEHKMARRRKRIRRTVRDAAESHSELPLGLRRKLCAQPSFLIPSLHLNCSMAVMYGFSIFEV